MLPCGAVRALRGKLKATPDGDGTLLDHSAILYGGALSDGNAHSNVESAAAGGGSAGRRACGGPHIQLAEPTPATNLFVTLLDGAGVNVETFGDCTGRLDLRG